MTRQGIEIHFFKHTELDPYGSSAGCYIRVSDVDPFYQACVRQAWPSQGIPRLDPLENKPWGLREFAVVDPDGSLIRIGQILSDQRVHGHPDAGLAHRLAFVHVRGFT